MIISNLSVLLAERSLTISKVSTDTGISRTTLTSLANNYNQGIQLETLDTICRYLNITPKEFFIYSPYDLSVTLLPFPKSTDGTDYMKINLNVSENFLSNECNLNFEVLIQNDNVYFMLTEVDNIDIFERFFKTLNQQLIKKFETILIDVLNPFIETLSPTINSKENLKFLFNWNYLNKY